MCVVLQRFYMMLFRKASLYGYVCMHAYVVIEVLDTILFLAIIEIIVRSLNMKRQEAVEARQP